jgi:hypothetical protein
MLYALSGWDIDHYIYIRQKPRLTLSSMNCTSPQTYSRALAQHKQA